MTPEKMIGGAVAFIIVAVLFTTYSWPVEEIETYYTSEPLTFEQTFMREQQVNKPCFPRIVCEVTQVQLGLKNTDAKAGNFRVNVVFDNGRDVDSKTDSASILPGEEKTLAVDAPLNGLSEVRVNIAPPTKSVAHQRSVTKKVTALQYVWQLRWLRLR